MESEMASLVIDLLKSSNSNKINSTFIFRVLLKSKTGRYLVSIQYYLSFYPSVRVF